MFTHRMVTYSKAHLLFRMNGGFGGLATPLDYWSAGLRIDISAAGGAVTEAEKLAFLTAVQSPTNVFFTNGDVKCGNNSSLFELTAAYIGLDGKYVGGASQDTTRLTWAGVTGSGASIMPWASAQAFTLRTQFDRGRAHVGRFYLPCQRTVGNDGRWTVNEAQLAVAPAKTFLDAVNAAAKTVWSGSFGVTIFSGLGSGEHHRVTRVEMGRAPDTQRRRDNKLVEDWQGADLAGASVQEVERAWTL